MKKSSKRKVIKSVGKSGNKVTKIIHESTKEIKIERALVENFIALQKVMVNLSGKFDDLSGQISKLLELFEISAKSLAKRDFEDLDKENIATKRIMEKLDNLTQQAGLIGRGLALIHEANSEKDMPQRSMPMNVPARPIGQMTPIKPRPTLPSIPQSTKQTPSDEYRKSALSRVSETN